jgi:hypothetical protein
MPKRAVRILHVILLLGAFLAPAGIHAQRERQMPPPDETQFGSKFFDQLSSIFGKFRDSDLQRVFQLARPIQCTELVTGKGEWRPVAFFNENRKLGDWYRSSLDEVKTDVSVYIFKGSCRDEHSTLQLTTKFPVDDSIDAYNSGKIPLDQIDVNVNAPVNVTFDTRTGAYNFDLPYLFLVHRDATANVYSLNPPHFGDKYVADMTDVWDCKSVSSVDITFRFLICRTSTAARGQSVRNQSRSVPTYGSSAYFILSDGSEAHSTVTLNFGGPDSPPVPSDTAAAPTSDTPAAAGWQAPGYRTPILDVGKSEFRLRFNPDTWMDRIATAQVVSDQKVMSLQAAKTQEGVDYCVWTPGSANLARKLLSGDPDADVAFSVSGIDKGGAQSTSSVTFLMKTFTGSRLGTLQCFFPRADSAEAAGYDRWSAIVGGQIKLEVRP